MFVLYVLIACILQCKNSMENIARERQEEKTTMQETIQKLREEKEKLAQIIVDLEQKVKGVLNLKQSDWEVVRPLKSIKNLEFLKAKHNRNKIPRQLGRAVHRSRSAGAGAPVHFAGAGTGVGKLQQKLRQTKL